MLNVRLGSGNMKINRLSPDIYEVEDFVTIEQQEEILKFASGLDEEQWWLSVNDDYKNGFFYGKQYNGEKPEVFKEIDTGDVDFFSLKNPNSLVPIMEKYSSKIDEERSKVILDNVKMYSHENVGKKWKALLEQC